MIDQLKNKTLIIFGAGTLAQKVINECNKNNLQISYILDNDVSRHNTIFGGYTIKSPKDITLKDDEIILVASSFSIEIQKQLRELSLKNSIDFINYNLLFPYLNGEMKFSIQLEELSDIGYILNYSTDDVGVLLRKGNKVYRAIYSNKICETNNVLKILQENNFVNNLIISTEVSSEKTSNFPIILKHPFIPYCSDSRSWSYSMIKDGLYKVSYLIKELHKVNLTLKDAHGMNLTYFEGKYQWIDFGSIVEGVLEKNVIIQLLEWFLFPCILMVNGQSRAYYEHNYNGRILYFMVQPFLDAEGKAILKDLYNGEKTDENMYLLLEIIEKWSDRYLSSKMKQEITIWEDYQRFNKQDIWNTEQWSKKQKVVFQYIKKCEGNTLIDIAGNNGWFCEISSKHFNMNGILIDYDHKCIENAYLKFKKEEINFIPLVNDFNNFPENILFIKQDFKFDVVLCLAFIHHLIFSNGYTFEKVRDTLYKVSGEYLIIEFIEQNDEYVSMWMNQYFTWYNKQNFEEVFSKKYSIVSVENVSESRIIYLMKKNQVISTKQSDF